jgi:hypothetical protein
MGQGYACRKLTGFRKRRETEMPEEKKPEGEEPEALRSLEAAARTGGKKPSDQGLAAKPDTEPLPDSPDREAKTAEEVLQAGVKHDPHAATEAVQKSKDPRIP